MAFSLPVFMLSAVPVLAFLASVCEADDICGGKYCDYGCCGYRDRDCCTSTVGLIAGLCVGAGVLIVVIIIVICICRRRRYGGIVYRSQAQPMMVVQHGPVNTQGGVVTTAGVQPGVIYPPYQQYPGYPPNYGYITPTSPPAEYQQPHQSGPYPPQPIPHAAGPPTYDESLQQPGGGVNNPGFDQKN